MNLIPVGNLMDPLISSFINNEPPTTKRFFQQFVIFQTATPCNLFGAYKMYLDYGEKD